MALARDRHARVDSRIIAYEVTARERMSAHMEVAGFERLLARRETATVYAEAMAVLRDLLASGQTHPCGQSAYPLAEAGEALRALERAEVPGRIVLLM